MFFLEEKGFNPEGVGGGMFRFGPAGYPPGSRSPTDALRKLHALGLNALELQFVRQARMGERKASEIREAAEELDIKLSAHAPYYINFDSRNPETVAKSREWLLRTVRIAHSVGAGIVVLHAAVYGEDPEATTSRIVEGLTACREAMVEEGTSDVLLGLETMGRKAAWGTMDEIPKVMAEVKGCVPVLDFAHLHAREGGALKGEGDFRKAIEAWERVCERGMHCHFSCVEYGERGERRHLPLEAKEPDIALLAKALKGKEYDVTVITESPLIERDALRAKLIFEGEPSRGDYVYH
jgi:deoxyribonuclease-4